MSARVPEPCDAPVGEHEGPVRFYRTGWACAAHAPKPRTREADEQAAPHENHLTRQ